ncbi:NERD domain-containing protein [Lentibacillus sp. N15]|uniref:NERD domain-containing protein n=1 Tax=Lentibacillus songyuanensis TaxID=3136161 RepID=UPI0031BB50C4
MRTIKYRKKPYIILCYEALFRNLNGRYRTNRKLRENYQRFHAGYQGEKTVDYNLMQFPQKNFFVLHDIRLKIHNVHFQIDTLIIYEKFILILEIKNLAGIIEYDSKLRQLVQINSEKKIALQDPILQAETQKEHLKAWLQQLNISIPIDTLVVNANPSTIINIKQDDPAIYLKLIRNENLHLTLNKITEKYTSKVLLATEISKLSNTILNWNTPLHPNLIKQFNVQERHLKTAITCPECGQPSIKRARGKWVCQKCHTIESNLHEQIILDYFLLHHSTITNRQCRSLLNIDSPRVVYKLLNSLSLKYTGQNSARIYYAPELDDYPQDTIFPGKFQSILDTFD